MYPMCQQTLRRHLYSLAFLHKESLLNAELCTMSFPSHRCAKPKRGYDAASLNQTLNPRGSRGPEVFSLVFQSERTPRSTAAARGDPGSDPGRAHRPAVHRLRGGHDRAAHAQLLRDRLGPHQHDHAHLARRLQLRQLSQENRIHDPARPSLPPMVSATQTQCAYVLVSLPVLERKTCVRPVKYQVE